MINKKIAISAFSLFSAVMLLVGTAYAAAVTVDQITAPSNVLASSTDILEIGATSTTTHDSIPNALLSVSGIKPNSSSTQVFYLKDKDTSSITTSVVFNTVSGDTGGPGHLDNDLTVGISCDNGQAIAPVAFTSFEGVQTFSGTLGGGDTTKCTLTASLGNVFTVWWSPMSRQFETKFKIELNHTRISMLLYQIHLCGCLIC